MNPINSETKIQALRNCRGFLLDMDGTIYVDDALIPGAIELITLLREKKVPYLFLTNNSSSSGEKYLNRLQRLGIPATREDIFTSGDATAEFLLDETAHRKVYLVGTPELEETFVEKGLELDSQDPDCVVLGFDRTLTYEKLEIACRHLFAGKDYYATHPDKTCITSDGLIPDIAAIIAANEAVTGRLPKIIGKPSEAMVKAALRRLKTQVSETAMVGDQLDTDMTMARQSGLCGVLVMTGETHKEQLEACLPGSEPSLVARSVAEIVEWLD